MAQNGNDWNSFMQSKPVQLALYGVVVLFCLMYGVDALMEMMSPERSAQLMSMIGAPGYYAVTIARAVVCFATGIAFGRVAYKTFTEKDD